MKDEFDKGWQMAVDWIYKETVAKGLDKGYNPKGKEVADRMKKLQDGQDGGFAEGLIYAIYKPLSELKTKIAPSKQ